MENYAKGKYLENVIQKMYLSTEYSVEKNKYIPPLYSSGRTRKREIDILITKNVAGLDIRIAIECKNENSPIGSPKIDSFVGKLISIGIPTSTSIYVSSSGYTHGAIERAKQAKILLLEYKKIDKNSMLGIHDNTGKITLFTMLIISKVVLTNHYNKEGIENILFFNKDMIVVGTILDLLYKEWVNNNIKDTLGEFDIQLGVPENWLQINSDGILERTDIIIIEGDIIALTLENKGESSVHSLNRQGNSALEKLLIRYEFEQLEEKEYSLNTITTEDELTDISKKYNNLITIRSKIPRIKYGAMYWPPSDNTFKQLGIFFEKHKDKYTAGEGLPIMRIEDIEGKSINAAFLPPSEDYLDRLTRIVLKKSNS